MSHAELGCALVATWRIPEDLVKAIGWHHNPLGADPLWQKPAAAIFICDNICRMKGIALDPKPSPEEELKLAEVMALLKVAPEALELIAGDVMKELDDLEAKGELYI